MKFSNELFAFRHLTYLLVNEISVRRVGIASQSGGGEDEQQSDAGQWEDGRHQETDDVNDHGPLLAGHDSHNSADHHHSSAPETWSRTQTTRNRRHMSLSRSELCFKGNQQNVNDHMSHLLCWLRCAWNLRKLQSFNKFVHCNARVFWKIPAPDPKVGSLLFDQQVKAGHFF